MRYDFVKDAALDKVFRQYRYLMKEVQTFIYAKFIPRFQH